MIPKNLMLVFLMLSFYTVSLGQNDSVNSPLKFSGYVETYFSFDRSMPDNHNRASFAYSFNRHNEFNINLGFIKAAYNTNNVRGNLALMSGTYANANLAAEPGILKNILEANIGVKISKSKNLWIDAGIFAAHIGFESAIGKDCWNLTRSIMADNSPYYESGAKIGYTSNDERWFLSALIINGWQRIQRVSGNNTPAFGHQLIFKPSVKVLFNSSSFVGSDTPDSARQMRYFHNFYGQFQCSKRLGLIAAFDIGAQQNEMESTNYHLWHTSVVTARFALADKLMVAARGEYYHDANSVIIATGTTNGFLTYGYSLNLDYNITNSLVWRIEGRAFNSKDKIFTLDKKDNNQNYFFTTSLAIAI